MLTATPHSIIGAALLRNFAISRGFAQFPLFAIRHGHPDHVFRRYGLVRHLKRIAGTMFAIVRTGGKQYRVAAGDKIAVEKLAGEAGETITLGDILLAGKDGELADPAAVTVSAEIIAQAKSEKVIVFKKRRRHNYRRKNGHRQQLTLLRILSVA
ncbi:50S ribosomal protein L21 [Novosphingobium sp. FSW06-99]|uniref:50S ribosomal protein L21 n=1 Tax=Novosphingobium sp. FSW06-99 TaxID=1739113 RepID=UPI001E5C06EE|nr:50S ribosomal protein L21 [Novosphingobium sp. FSW06-99]